MHIGIDLTSLMPDRTGVDTVVRELVLALRTIDNQNDYTLFLNREDIAEFRTFLPPSFRPLAVSTRNRAIRAFAQQTWLPAACFLHSIDVLHSPAFLTPLVHAGTRQLVTVHDMTFFTLPEAHSSLHRSRVFRQAVKWSAHRADLVHVPSAATRSALLEQWPAVPAERIRVIPWGIADAFSPAHTEEIRRHRIQLGLPERFILFTGTIEPRKNVDTLIESYRRLMRNGGSDLHLVLAGRPGWNYQSVMGLLKAGDLRERVHYLGYVKQESLPWVYRAASIFVYPSQYEGFGLPPLEAMACGVPTIASKGSALEDNLHGAAELVEPAKPAVLEAALRKLLAEPPDARGARISAGLKRAREFSWTKTAHAMLTCYGEVSGFASGSPPPRR
jgi:glycosyltransferase involved in cell wall biosynthesis